MAVRIKRRRKIVKAGRLLLAIMSVFALIAITIGVTTLWYTGPVYIENQYVGNYHDVLQGAVVLTLGLGMLIGILVGWGAYGMRQEL
jgi:hypothetical protein